MLKKGNVYRYKDKLWVYAGFIFTNDKNCFVHHRFFRANKPELEPRDVFTFRRDVFKHMVLEPTATVLYGRKENDEQMTDILTGKFFQQQPKWRRAGTSIAMNINYDITHIYKTCKKNTWFNYDFYAGIIVRSGLRSTSGKSK